MINNQIFDTNMCWKGSLKICRHKDSHHVENCRQPSDAEIIHIAVCFKRSDVLWKISRLSVFENVLFIMLGKVPLKIQ